MFGNISQLLEMKKKADELKAKLEAITVTETYRGITVDCNGNRRILAIHIEQLNPNDKQKLEDDLCVAVNNALSAAEKAALGDIAGLTGGMAGLGSLFNK